MSLLLIIITYCKLDFRNIILLESVEMAKIELGVVDIEGELLFKTKPSQKEVIFDRLDAGPFDGGELTILRDNQELTKTKAIAMTGTHAACVCFCGLDRPFGDFGAVDSILSEDFKAGDSLLLEIPTLPDDFDLGEELFKQYVINEAMRKMPIGEDMPLGDFFDKLGNNMAEVDLTPLSIIRLRPAKKLFQD